MPTLYLDCDGFFASCEEADDPTLHGRPVAVSTTDADNPGAVLIAVNPTAKRLGVGKGENAREARKSVRDLVVRSQRPERYVAIHHAIARAVDTVLPGAQPRSIDELSVELDSGDDPERILAQVKSAIRKAVGPIITVSCGIAPSHFLAKPPFARRGEQAGRRRRVAPGRHPQGVRGARALGPPGTRARNGGAAPAPRHRLGESAVRCRSSGGSVGVGVGGGGRYSQSPARREPAASGARTAAIDMETCLKCGGKLLPSRARGLSGFVAPALPLATIRSRRFLLGANTPWNR